MVQTIGKTLYRLNLWPDNWEQHFPREESEHQLREEKRVKRASSSLQNLCRQPNIAARRICYAQVQEGRVGKAPDGANSWFGGLTRFNYSV